MRDSTATMAELEDLEFGKSDFVLLDEVAMEPFMENLRLRWVEEKEEEEEEVSTPLPIPLREWIVKERDGGCRLGGE